MCLDDDLPGSSGGCSPRPVSKFPEFLFPRSRRASHLLANFPLAWSTTSSLFDMLLKHAQRQISQSFGFKRGARQMETTRLQSSLITLERDLNPKSGKPSGVVVVTLNSPKTLNAMTEDLGEAFKHEMTQLAKDDSVRCIVLTGSGEKAFSAGGDMTFLKQRHVTSPVRNVQVMRYL